MAGGMVDSDPTRDLWGNLTPVTSDKHFAAVTDPTEVVGLLRAIRGYDGIFVVQAALQLGVLMM